jgi:iron(III) transport system ATP-binding protein
MSALGVQGLWKGYGRQPVLHGVDLQAPAGSLTAVLGLSGCGKTTLLRCVAGFERAERGTIVLGQRTLDDGRTFLAPERRSVGYVPQEGALFPHLDVAGNVGFGLSRGERRGETVARMLAMVGIDSLAERMPHQLSGGEQQRVALARALVRRPEALLLDEPFSSLDASLRSRVREEVTGLLREQGVTTVLVTHDQEEALSLADTVAVLRDGVIVQQGTPAELYEQPADRRLAHFLGAVNVLEASFRDGVAQTVLGPLPLREPAPGSEGEVMVRPEQLLVVPTGEASAQAAGPGLSGQVQQCRYYGHDAILQIDAAGSPLPLVARVLGEHALPAGTAVLVSARGTATPVR